MARIMESSTQVKGIAEIAHDVRVVVRHTFLEFVEDDEVSIRHAQGACFRSSSEPRKLGGHMKQLSTSSTQATDADDDTEMASDEEEATAPALAPPGVWTQPSGSAKPAEAQFVPVCVAFVPVVQQLVWKKSSRSARRRRARAMNRWFRQQEAALEDGDAEFDDDWQVPENDDIAESPNLDAEIWPMPNLPSRIQDKKAIKE